MGYDKKEQTPQMDTDQQNGQQSSTTNNNFTEMVDQNNAHVEEQSNSNQNNQDNNQNNSGNSQKNATTNNTGVENVVAYDPSTDPQILALNDQIALVQKRAANTEAPETPEEKAKREKKERSRRTIAAISDGLQALSNLYFTSQGAPNMYDYASSSGTSAVDKAIEKAKADRKANNDAYYAVYDKLYGLNQAKAKTMQELAALEENRRIKREQEKREEEKHKSDMAYNEARTAAQNLANSFAEDNNEAKQELWESQVYKNKKQGDAAGKRTSSGGGKSGSGRGSGKNSDYTETTTTDQVIVDRYGQEHHVQKTNVKEHTSNNQKNGQANSQNEGTQQNKKPTGVSWNR